MEATEVASNQRCDGEVCTVGNRCQQRRRDRLVLIYYKHESNKQSSFETRVVDFLLLRSQLRLSRQCLEAARDVEVLLHARVDTSVRCAAVGVVYAPAQTPVALALDRDVASCDHRQLTQIQMKAFYGC